MALTQHDRVSVGHGDPRYIHMRRTGKDTARWQPSEPGSGLRRGPPADTLGLWNWEEINVCCEPPPPASGSIRIAWANEAISRAQCVTLWSSSQQPLFSFCFSWLVHVLWISATW